MFEYLPVPKKQNIVKLTCSQCSSEFERHTYNIKGGLSGFAKRFCSPKCQIAYKKENGREYSRPSPNRQPGMIYRGGRAYKMVNCTDCGIEMERRSDLVKKAQYCKPCLSKIQSRTRVGNTYNPKTGGILTCKACSKEFYFVASKLSTRKYCSKECMHEWQREHQDRTKFIMAKMSGANHPQFKHGKRVGKHIGKPKLRKEIIERDGGNWCLFCGKPGPGLHLHRVVYGSQGGKYELSNCIQLCGEHHALVHSSKTTWQEPLLRYLADTTKTGRAWLDSFRTLLEAKR